MREVSRYKIVQVLADYVQSADDSHESRPWATAPVAMILKMNSMRR